MITTVALLLAVAVLAALLGARLTQKPGRHRDHGHPGATPGYARLLASWNQRGRHG
jgi:hypothetical protein